MFWILLFWAVWLVLWGDFSILSFASGFILACAVFYYSKPFLKHNMPLRPLKWSVFWLKISYDIILANFTVAKQVLNPYEQLKPAIIEVPTVLEDELALAIFCSIINIVPGTLTMRIDREHRLVVVHVLSTDTPEAILQELKTRYEKPLLQLFAS